MPEERQIFHPTSSFVGEPTNGVNRPEPDLEHLRPLQTGWRDPEAFISGALERLAILDLHLRSRRKNRGWVFPEADENLVCLALVRSWKIRQNGS